jgi:hypothetical protein
MRSLLTYSQHQASTLLLFDFPDRVRQSLSGGAAGTVPCVPDGLGRARPGGGLGREALSSEVGREGKSEHPTLNASCWQWRQRFLICAPPCRCSIIVSYRVGPGLARPCRAEFVGQCRRNGAVCTGRAGPGWAGKPGRKARPGDVGRGKSEHRTLNAGCWPWLPRYLHGAHSTPRFHHGCTDVFRGALGISSGRCNANGHTHQYQI